MRLEHQFEALNHYAQPDEFANTTKGTRNRYQLQGRTFASLKSEGMIQGVLDPSMSDALPRERPTLPTRMRADMNDEAKEFEEPGERAAVVESHSVYTAGGSKGGAFINERRLSAKRSERSVDRGRRNH